MERRMKEKSRGKTGNTAAGCKRRLHNESYLAGFLKKTVQDGAFFTRVKAAATPFPQCNLIPPAPPLVDGCFPIKCVLRRWGTESEQSCSSSHS